MEWKYGQDMAVINLDDILLINFKNVSSIEKAFSPTSPDPRWCIIIREVGVEEKRTLEFESEELATNVWVAIKSVYGL